MIYDKNELRAQMKEKRKNLTHSEIEEKSARICSFVTGSDVYKRAECVCVYMAAFNEPRTMGIIQKAISDGKRVCVPITDIESGTLTLSYITGLSDLKRGAYGIYEPTVICAADSSDVDLILVPGIAFDSTGNRIGFGKGFYDKLLCGCGAVKAGICYDFQICPPINKDIYDVPMDIIITEEGIRLCR